MHVTIATFFYVCILSIILLFYLFQKGQFFCQSPVTSMCFLDNQLQGKISVAYGDELGFVHLLVWKFDQGYAC